MKKLNRRGFTMVELLIVLAIIAILAAVAIPVYSSQLEASRKKVDESNLRAATGLAAQDYLLRYAGEGTGSTMGGISNGKGQNYVVYILKDAQGNAEVTSQNMLVYPGTGKIDDKGNWYPHNGGTTPTASFTITLPANDKNTYNQRHGTINGKGVYFFPLQQNGGKAKFDIEIGPNGVVRNSRIVTF